MNEEQATKLILAVRQLAENVWWGALLLAAVLLVVVWQFPEWPRTLKVIVKQDKKAQDVWRSDDSEA